MDFYQQEIEKFRPRYADCSSCVGELGEKVVT